MSRAESDRKKKTSKSTSHTHTPAHIHSHTYPRQGLFRERRSGKLMAGGRQAYEWWPKTVNQARHKSFGPPDEAAHDLSIW